MLENEIDISNFAEEIMFNQVIEKYNLVNECKYQRFRKGVGQAARKNADERIR